MLDKIRPLYLNCPLVRITAVIDVWDLITLLFDVQLIFARDNTFVPFRIIILNDNVFNIYLNTTFRSTTLLRLSSLLVFCNFKFKILNRLNIWAIATIFFKWVLVWWGLQRLLFRRRQKSWKSFSFNLFSNFLQEIFLGIQKTRLWGSSSLNRYVWLHSKY
jgi:hypothetical protein